MLGVDPELAQVECTFADVPGVAQATAIMRRASVSLRHQLGLFCLCNGWEVDVHGSLLLFRNCCSDFLAVVCILYGIICLVLPFISGTSKAKVEVRDICLNISFLT